ncbi:heavy metal translocating P-type ATPase [Hyphococcus luteus]|uniref:Heavy metal translocating P-type ATPase n=1 Tax=Hyphococcus luteus TaxID=2058213 RepID=A0A2S7K8R6_9PROT|nr:heavy metal translocating P-type ATPase [Marinicaulis flavus]PQA88878.1 heavy metal translocating P-type ATPase [Marinicaulis flavus]
MTTATAETEIGCPSGLEPPADGVSIDPAPFVRRSNGLARLDLAVFGAKCAGCIRKIESAMNALPEMQSARLNLSTGRLSLVWKDGAFAPREIAERLDAIGYRAAPFDPEKVEQESDREGRKLLRSLAVAGFATANVMLLSISVWAGGGEMGPATRELMHWVSAMIAVPAALYAGRPFFSSALRALKSGHANMDVPISLAVLLALSLSIFEFFKGGPHTYFDAAVMLLFFLLIGRYLDHRLRLRARAAARDLLALQAATSSRLNEDGTLTSVAARDIVPGDRLLLAPGDRAPVDCVIEEGDSNLDMSLVSGESAPVHAQEGTSLYSGVLNLTSKLTVRATKSADASLVADLTRLIEAGEQSKSRYIKLADKAASLYVPVVHTLALATFLGWMFIGEAGLRVSVMNAVAVLIITCPCALGLAAPAVQVVATGRLFRSGVLVKSGDALERLAEIDAVVFDKTGTLTYGKPRLANREEISDETLRAAASLARVSRHPLARAIVAEAGPGKPAPDAVETAGAGIEGTIDGERARLGRAAWVGAESAADDDAQESWFRLGDAPPVRFRFEDRLREDACESIADLEKLGLEVEMLSGDRQAAAASIAERLGVKAWRAELQPQQKIERLEELKAKGVKVAMVGDGLNDAPSLACAHASFSPGSAADASQAAADYVYQGDNLAPIAETVVVARAARRRMLENFGFAALYNACAVPLAALGHVTPLIAAIAMSGSSIIVTLNALRLSMGKRRKS